MSKLSKTLFFFIYFVSLATVATPDFSALVQGFKKIGLNRFQSSLSYDATKRAISKRLGASQSKFQAEEEINLPHVRTISYLILDITSEIFAIDVYQNMQLGLTEIFFVKRGTFGKGKM